MVIITNSVPTIAKTTIEKQVIHYSDYKFPTNLGNLHILNID